MPVLTGLLICTGTLASLLWLLTDLVSKMSSAFFTFMFLLMYFVANGIGSAPLILEAVLRLKNDLGVHTVMFVRNPLFTEKHEPR